MLRTNSLESYTGIKNSLESNTDIKKQFGKQH